jgi:hypothetical protein
MSDKFHGEPDDVGERAHKPNGSGAAQADHGDGAWPVMDPAAYHGLAGEVVSTMAPQTEADRVSLLLQFLVYFGNSVGRGPFYQVNADRHFTNLYLLLAGLSSKARKGLSAGLIRALMMLADPDWARNCLTSGLSSGEGVLHAIRDPQFAMKNGDLVQTDPGIADKRILLEEREFFSALAVMRREGNIVSRIIRDAWDCLPTLRTLTKHTPTKVTNAFISIVGHITITELAATLDHTSMANGYANRFLFACVRRGKMMPFGGDVVEIAKLAERTKEMIEAARSVERVMMTDDAQALWREVYEQLSAERPGLLAAITARAEAQTIRMALIYALLDGEDSIDRTHLEAGLAVWEFCQASARHIFGDVTGDTAADAILRALRHASPNGKTRTEISDLFSHNRSGGEIARALELLLTSGKARHAAAGPPPGLRGRPVVMWFAT